MSLKTSVGAGALVFQNEKILLVQMNYGQFKGHWILPGGLLEHGEDPESAAKRELKEETNQEGRIITPHSIRFRKNPANIYWVFKMEIVHQKPIEYSRNELMDVKFWPIQEALHDLKVRPMTKYFIKTALSKDVDSVDFPERHKELDTVYFFNG